MAIRKVYSIGFTRRTAEDFFETLKKAGIEQLVDIRLKNASQLAGFTKREDLPYFLQTICGATYRHEPNLAPTPEIMDAFKKSRGAWSDFEKAFLNLLAARGAEKVIPRSTFDRPTVLLCSEPGPERCHRRLVLEYLQRRWGDIEIIHL